MMRIFVFFGGLIVVALAALFIGPHAVDWTDHRAWFEREASALVGAPVKVRGDVDLTLLPQPILSFEDVTIGGGGPKAQVGRFRLILATTPLLRGEMRATEMAVERARIEAVVEEDGALRWPFGALSSNEAADRAILDDISVSDSTISLLDRRTGAATTIDALNFEGGAQSLAGPFKADGGFRIDGRPHSFRLSTARIENGAMRFKASATPSDMPITGEIEGRLAFSGKKPAFDGRISLIRPPVRDAGEGAPWRFEGRAKIDAEAAIVEQFDLSYGPDDSRVVLSGSGRRGLGRDGGLSVKLSARQIDLDRFFNLKGSAAGTADLQGKLARFLETAPIFAAPPKNAQALVEIGGVVAGGGVASNLRFDLAGRENGWTVRAAEASLPGSSRLSFAGSVDLSGGEERLDGDVALKSSNVGALRSWLSGFMDASILTLAPGRLDASARLALGRRAIVVEGLDLALGDARLSGQVSVKNRSLDAALKASRLDLDRLLPEEARRRGLAFASGLPFNLKQASLNLDAEALTLSGVQGEGFSTLMTVADGVLTIDRLSAARLGGVAVSASGRIAGLGGAAPEGRLDLTAKADDLDGLSQFLLSLEKTRAIGEGLRRRQASLAPFDAKAVLTFAPDQERRAGRLVVEGAAGGSAVSLEASLAGGQDVSATMRASSDSAGRLLAQLGLPVIAGDRLGRGDLNVSATGPLQGPFVVSAVVETASSRLSLSGAAARAAQDRPAAFDLKMDSRDLASLGAAFGLTPPGLRTDAPFNMTAKLSEKEGGVWALEAVAGDVVGSALRGDVLLTPGARLGVRGALRLDDIDLGALVAAGLGGDTRPGSGETPWSEAAFSEPALTRLEGDLTLEADRARMGGAVRFEGAKMRLTFGLSGFALRDLEGRTAGGTFKGTLEGRKLQDGVRRLALRLKIERARLEELVWMSSGRPVATGGLTVSAELEAEGRSPASLFAQMAGSGSLVVEAGEIRGMNPLAFDLIIRAADAGLDLKEEQVRGLFAGHLGSGKLDFGRAEGAFVVSGGVARLRNLNFENHVATSFASGRLDIGKLLVDSEWSLAVKDAGDVKGRQPPAVALLFQGPLARPKRDLDVSTLVGFLTMRAFEKEVERLEFLQEDILERQRFTRELVRLGQDRRRREREAEEARRRVAEENARRVAEDRARAAAAKAAADAAKRETAVEQPNIIQQLFGPPQQRRPIEPPPPRQ